LYVPDTVGVPLMVMVLPAKDGVTPGGKPVAVPIPVAPVVVWVTDGVSGVLIQIVGVKEAGPILQQFCIVMVAGPDPAAEQPPPVTVYVIVYGPPGVELFRSITPVVALMLTPAGAVYVPPGVKPATVTGFEEPELQAGEV
jgi:hypothetical protein